MENELKELTQRKLALKQDSEDFKLAVETDVEELKVEAKEKGTLVLVIGGSLLVVYGLFRVFSDLTGGDAKKSKKSKYMPALRGKGNKNPLFQTVMNQIALFLLGIAKQKITVFLKEEQKNGK